MSKKWKLGLHRLLPLELSLILCVSHLSCRRDLAACYRLCAHFGTPPPPAQASTAQRMHFVLILAQE